MKIRLSAAAVAVATALSVPAFAVETTGEVVVVTATRQKQRANEVMASVEIIDRKTIERSGHTTLPELLAGQSGLRVVANGGAGANSSVFIRGAESRHTLLLVDGVRIGSATSGQPALELIPLALIERVEILRGPASALYGSEAIGGVIQVFTRRGEAGFHPQVFAGYGTEDTRSLNASVSGGAHRLRYSVSAGHDSTDGFNAKPDPTTFGANADRDGFRNDYLSASASIGFREHDEIGVSAFHSEGRNEYDANRTFDSYLDKRLSSVNAHLVNRLSQGWTSTLRVGHSVDRLRDSATARPSTHLQTDQSQFVWQHDVRLPVGSLMAAYEYLDQRVDTTAVFAKDERQVQAVLLGWTARVGRHNLQANLRHDDNSQFGHETTGYAGYGYALSDAWRVHGSIGTAFNAPTFNQLYFPDIGFFRGNPDLRPEKALNREIGIRWDGAAHAVGVTYFNNRVRNLIAGFPLPQNVNRAKLEGVELAYEGSVFGFDVRAGYDFLDARDESTGNRLPRRADEAAFLSVARTQGAWSWGVDWNGEGRRFDNAANTVRLEGYGLLNAFVHYAFAPDWRVELRANNVLDKDYQLANGFAAPGASTFVGVRYAPR